MLVEADHNVCQLKKGSGAGLTSVSGRRRRTCCVDVFYWLCWQFGGLQF